MWTIAKWYVSNTWNKMSEWGKILVVTSLVFVATMCFHTKFDDSMSDSLNIAKDAIHSADSIIKANDSLKKVIVKRDKFIAASDTTIVKLNDAAKQVEVLAKKQRVSITTATRPDRLTPSSDGFGRARTHSHSGAEHPDWES
jgi:hypothetical protein